MTVDIESSKVEGGPYVLKIFQATLNILSHLLIGLVVGICLIFSLNPFRLPLGSTPQHIVLCVIGYQLLMAEAILSLSADNGWSGVLRFRDKRRAHTILQVVGSALALAGSFIKMLDKTQNFNTLHGQFGLVAVVFTSVSLVNGLTSLYAFEWRRFCPGNISKITHICFGIVAFAAASISLCYGFDKAFFRVWATDNFTNALIGCTAAFTAIIIINPTINFFKKTYNLVSN
ncbi:uncharacterized protein LOC123709384 [Pieris brassicae]|uniref:uncharacterized protein LOC123709384 n=1 Tax=Pieris brassicae TaxID=7116 RepID=UPI001E65F4E5|nr:uncharacterized protein LOC123709384 [Pieris brassicae]